ncbi:MAG: CoA transferase subunit A [Nitrospinota bacterium]
MVQILDSAFDAIRDVQDGAVILSGGFGLAGIPENLIRALLDKGVKHLTLISNSCGAGERGLATLAKARRIRKFIGSRTGCKFIEEQYFRGEVELELIPQGTLAERIRAGGAGVGGFYTPVGVGTVVAEGKEVREIDGRTYLLERPITADFALVRAWRGDAAGNLVYRMSARNFNPAMATAGRVTIAEVEEIVPAGALDPDCIHTPGIFVQRMFRGAEFERFIEIRTTRPRPAP